MIDDLAEVVAKLREIEEQAFSAGSEVPAGSIASSRIRHIALLTKYARMRLEGIKVQAMDPLNGNGTPPARPE